MKIFTIIVMTFFLQKGCDAQSQKEMKDVMIEYTAVSRGFHQKIIVTNQTVSIFKTRNQSEKPVPTKISDADWEIICTNFQAIKLDQMATLKSPTQKRFHDGAAIGDLKIDIQGKTYKSQSFDHGNPPKEFKELVDKINTFAKKE
jgi:hypothetical protein